MASPLLSPHRGVSPSGTCSASTSLFALIVVVPEEDLGRGGGSTLGAFCSPSFFFVWTIFPPSCSPLTQPTASPLSCFPFPLPSLFLLRSIPLAVPRTTSPFLRYLFYGQLPASLLPSSSPFSQPIPFLPTQTLLPYFASFPSFYHQKPLLQNPQKRKAKVLSIKSALIEVTRAGMLDTLSTRIRRRFSPKLLSLSPPLSLSPKILCAAHSRFSILSQFPFPAFLSSSKMGTSTVLRGLT